MMAEFTLKRARQHCRRRLATIDQSLVDMARHWDDLDMTVCYAIDEARAEIERLGTAMDEAVADEEERRRIER